MNDHGTLLSRLAPLSLLDLLTLWYLRERDGRCFDYEKDREMSRDALIAALLAPGRGSSRAGSAV